jgi:hypothetical protein
MGGGDLSTDVGVRAGMMTQEIVAPDRRAEEVAATASASRIEPGHALHPDGESKKRRRTRGAAGDLETAPDRGLASDDGLGPSEPDPHRLDQLA